MFNWIALINEVTDSTAQAASSDVAGSDIYVVMTVTLIIWIGIFLNMLLLDRKVKAVQRRLDAREPVAK